MPICTVVCVLFLGFAKYNTLHYFIPTKNLKIKMNVK